jgi:hypothetical protein
MSSSGSGSLDDTNSGKIKLDKEANGVLMRAVEKDFVAVGPGIPCGFTTKIVPLCENGAANLYTMLVQEGTTAAVDPDYSCSIASCDPDTYVSLASTNSPAVSLYTLPAADTDTDFDSASVADVKVSDGYTSCIKKVEFDNKKILQNDCSEVLLQADDSGGQSDDVYGFASDFTKTPETATVSIYDTRLEFECGVLVDKQTVSPPGGGGGSHSHDYYNPCCEPLYPSLGFTASPQSLSLGWTCLEWDGTKYQGLNTDSSGNAGPYSLSVSFDECGRGWTAVIEPLNTQSILGQLGSPDDMQDTEAAVGSYTYTGGGPVLFSDSANGVSLGDRKADDLDGCGDDLLDFSIFPASSTELINVSGAVQIVSCPTPAPPPVLWCGCEPSAYVSGYPVGQPTGNATGSPPSNVSVTYTYPGTGVGGSGGGSYNYGYFEWNDANTGLYCKYESDGIGDEPSDPATAFIYFDSSASEWVFEELGQRFVMSEYHGNLWGAISGCDTGPLTTANGGPNAGGPTLYINYASAQIDYYGNNVYDQIEVL